ncbi:hypothetical protein PVAND_012095 [Polypedilum vanderplanki]|uniref:Uncharacterized protein n=1 Tax=Polypedilum vanderplanki TaxID=319348 RepID=A0A9J6CKJ6_POLVA|nr:hypothetical protein PVAND_012095 [Polypedilum vanderplanki]
MFYLEIIALCFILFLLYETSNSLKYYLKFSIYYGGVILNSFLLFPYLLTRPTNVLNLITASKFCCHISKVLGLTWILRGAQHLQKDQM